MKLRSKEVLGGIFLLAIIAFIALNSTQLQLGSFVLTGEKVYVPSIATLTCRESTSTPQNAVSTNFVSGTDKAQYKDFFVGLTNEGKNYVYLDYFTKTDIFSTINPTYGFINFQCLGSFCELSGSTNPKDWVQCASGYESLFSVRKGGQQVAFNTYQYNGAYSPRSLVLTEQLDGFEAKLQQNQVLDMGAMCIKRYDAFGARSGEIWIQKPVKISIPYQQKDKQFELAVPGQVPRLLPSTQMCSWNAVYNATSGNTKSAPENIIESILNPKTGQRASPDYAKYVPQYGQISRSTVIEPYGVGEQVAFVYGWQIVDGVNVGKLDNGVLVVESPVNNKVYRVSKIASGDGTNFNVANEVYIENPQCLYDIPCQSTLGATAFCNKGGTNVAELYVCKKPAAGQGGNQCTSQTAVVDCGDKFYTRAGGTTTLNIPFCRTDNTCGITTSNTVCDPRSSYPNNLCPADKTICQINSDSTTSCVQGVVGKDICPTECCLESSQLYNKKDCAATFSCSINPSSGTGAGACIGTPKEDVCGDGICSLVEESKLGDNRCSLDCGEKQFACDIGYHMVSTKTPQYFLFVFKTGDIESNTCVPDLDINLVLSVAIIAVAVFGAAMLFKKNKKRKSGK